MLTASSIVQRHPEIIATQADQDIVMVSLATGYYYGISEVGRDIWNAIEEPKRVSDLINDLTRNYEIDAQSCERETLEFLEELINEGLVQIKNACNP
ncbi:MAG TPA: lasso peptide biosynthesis PqqD family chaperone [Spongiibacteraceae bacterium]|nr:lasso peptide biosynthesis PqqD family chaperone [Spongiibacteraceae bacterium]